MKQINLKYSSNSSENQFWDTFINLPHKSKSDFFDKLLTMPDLLEILEDKIYAQIIDSRKKEPSKSLEEIIECRKKKTKKQNILSNLESQQKKN